MNRRSLFSIIAGAPLAMMATIKSATAITTNNEPDPVLDEFRRVMARATASTKGHTMIIRDPFTAAPDIIFRVVERSYATTTALWEEDFRHYRLTQTQLNTLCDEMIS